MRNRFESFEVPVAVAIGGGLGALGRWGLAQWLPSGAFPTATFITNVGGCFALGVVLIVGESIGHPRHRHHRRQWARLWRPFFATGVLGGFTTFSTLVLEVDRLAAPVAMLYLVTSIGLGLVAYSLGNWGARKVFGVRA